MSKEKLFNKIKLETMNINITAVNISGRNVIIGEENGNLTAFEIKKNKLLEVSKVKLKSKIEKICIPITKKIAFILCGGDVYFVNLPKLENPQSLFISKDIVGIFLNLEDLIYENMFMVLEKKTKIALKMYEFDVNENKVDIKEKKFNKDLYLEKVPNCASWTENVYFVYALEKKSLWLNWNTGNYDSKDDSEAIIDMTDLYGMFAITQKIDTMFLTVFMQKGRSSSYNMLMHTETGFHCFYPFKNHSIGLYDNCIVIFKPREKIYSPVETINFDKGETGKFMVATRNKLIVLTQSGDNINFIDIQPRPFEEQIKVVLDKKEFSKGLEILIDNVPEDDDERHTKLEEFFLDCAWTYLEGKKKDFITSLKYITLTNFNPFEFIYAFCDELNVKIIHSDKEQDIINNKKENQLINSNTSEKEQKEALEYLMTILKMKRDYILENFIKSRGESENCPIDFMSSNRSKINLKNSETQVTIGETFYAINSTLIKCMIKLKLDPIEIENALDNETIDYSSNFKDFEKELFFSAERNKNLDETKFTLSYISEKYGVNYESVLEQWENFGKSKNEKYSFIGKERTKKLFYRFKEATNIASDEKEKLFRKHIEWLLEKYPEEVFEVITKTELVSNKIFMEEIIPKIKSTNEDLKEKFLVYCNQNHKTETYQTLLLQLYADKLFIITGKESKPKKLEGNSEKFYNLFMDIIKSKEDVYNKKKILEYIENSWLKDAKIILYAKLKEFNKALEVLFNEAKETLSFEEIEDFCKKNSENTNQKLYQKFYQLLSDTIKEYQDNIDKALEDIEKTKKNLDEKNPNNKFFLDEISKSEEEIKKKEEKKNSFEKEMLKILKKNGDIDTIDPMIALDYANDHMNMCQNPDFFYYLKKMVTDFTIEGNKYRITKNLSDIGLAYKAKEDYELKKKYVRIDSNKVCDLCQKKIGNTVFVVYPNLSVYHSKCALNLNIDPKTGIDFSRPNCIV